MIVQPVLMDVIDKTVQPVGFQRRGGSWYRLTNDIYAVVNVQKSSWDDSCCYINIAFTPANEVHGSWLPESKCMVRFRVEAINSISTEDLRLLQGVYEASDEDELRSALLDRIARPVMKILESARDLRGLKDVLKSQTSQRVLINRRMRALMDDMDPGI